MYLVITIWLSFCTILFSGLHAQSFEFQNTILGYDHQIDSIVQSESHEHLIRFIKQQIIPQSERDRNIHLKLSSHLKISSTFLSVDSVDSAFFYMNLVEKISSTHDVNDSIYSDKMEMYGEYYMHQKEYSEAIIYYLKALEIREQINHSTPSLIGRVLYKIGQCYYNQARRDHQQVETYYLRALKAYQQDNSCPVSTLAKLNLNIGKLYYNLRKNNLSISFYEEAKKQYKNLSDPKYNPIIIDINLRLGYLYTDQGNFIKTNAVLTRADSLIQQLKINNLPLKYFIPRSLSTWGDAYRSINDSERALNTYNKAILEWTKMGKASQLSSWKIYTGTLHQRIGSIYLKNEQYIKAITEYQKTIKFYTEVNANNRDIAIMYLNLADIFRTIDKIDSAQLYLSKAEKLIFPDLVSIHQRLVIQFWHVKAHISAAQINPNYNLKKEADYYYRKTTQGYEKSLGGHHHLVSLAYTNYANFKLAQKDYANALDLVSHAINAAYTKSNPKSMGNKRIPLSYDNLISALVLKGEILDTLYKVDASVAFLHQSYSIYKEADSLLNQISFSFVLEGSQLALRRKMRHLYERAIRACLELKRITNDEKYLFDAFQFSEKSKALLLLSSMQDQQAKITAGVDNTLLNKERDLKTKLAYYQKLLLSSPEDDSIRKLVIALNEDYVVFTKQLEQDYPEYYKLKYDLQVASIEDVQKSLGLNETMISYFYGEREIFAFLINKDISRVFLIPINDQLHKSIENLQYDITSTTFAENPEEAWSSFHQNASSLYHDILDSLVQDIPSDQSLIIIPDGELAYIPFEVLISNNEDIQNDAPISANLHFLIYDYAISYDYSATIHLESRKNVASYPLSCLGVAPDFRGTEHSPLSNDLAHVQKLSSGKYLTGPNATESNFKQYVEQYGILFLATHGKMDTTHLYSWLAFGDKEESEEDGYLYAYEIYNMQLNAQLAVLGACETGVGKQEKNEGIMSIARAFSFAGCPSILMSLWKAPATPTLEGILPQFYQKLSQNLSKAEALRQAKIDYLKNSDRLIKHPYYWASFVSTGNQMPLELKPAWRWFGLLISGLIIIALLGGYATYRILSKSSKA